MKFFEDYIKTLATNEKILARVVKISERKTSKNGKGYYSISWELPSTHEILSGALFEDAVKMNLEGQLPKPEEVLSVFLNGKGFVTYRRNDGLINNVGTVKAEREITNMKHDDDAEKKYSNECRDLQGIVQAMIIAKVDSTDVIDLASVMLDKIRRRAKERIQVKNKPEVVVDKNRVDVKNLDEVDIPSMTTDEVMSAESDLPF